MQLTHVTTNTGQGLRRHLSMHLAVILTLFVSLSLGGMGLMMRQETDQFIDGVSDQLVLNIYLCNDDDRKNPGCVGEYTDEQVAAIEKVLDQSSEVKSYAFRDRQYFFDKVKETYKDTPSLFEGKDATIKVDIFNAAIQVTLSDPNRSPVVESQVQSLDGISYLQPARDVVGPIFKVLDVLKYGALAASLVLILAALLQVANTIRLTAVARRREIEIMRLVGASRFFIALPFLLEALFDAVVGVLLGCGALAALMEFGITRGLAEHAPSIPLIGWHETLQTMVIVAIAGPLLTVVPTLLLTRKYLKY